MGYIVYCLMCILVHPTFLLFDPKAALDARSRSMENYLGRPHHHTIDVNVRPVEQRRRQHRTRECSRTGNGYIFGHEEEEEGELPTAIEAYRSSALKIKGLTAFLLLAFSPEKFVATLLIYHCPTATTCVAYTVHIALFCDGVAVIGLLYGLVTHTLFGPLAAGYGITALGGVVFAFTMEGGFCFSLFSICMCAPAIILIIVGVVAVLAIVIVFLVATPNHRNFLEGSIHPVIFSRPIFWASAWCLPAKFQASGIRR